jgi:hypothetical protein
LLVPAELRDQCAPQQPLEIQNQICSKLFTHCPGPRDQSQSSSDPPQPPARELEHFIDVWISVEKRSPFTIDYPMQLRIGPRRFDKRDGRKGVYDITKRAGLDDNDFSRRRKIERALVRLLLVRSRSLPRSAARYFPSASRSASRCGKPASIILS